MAEEVVNAINALTDAVKRVAEASQEIVVEGRDGDKFKPFALGPEGELQISVPRGEYYKQNEARCLAAAHKMVSLNPDLNKDVYGGIGVKNSDATTTITSASAKVQVTQFDTNGPSNGIIPSAAQGHLNIPATGDYILGCAVGAESVAGAAALFSWDLYANNGASAIPLMHAHREMAGGGGDVASITIGPFPATLTKDDTVELWVTNDTNTQNIIVDDISLMAMRVRD